MKDNQQVEDQVKQENPHAPNKDKAVLLAQIPQISIKNILDRLNELGEFIYDKDEEGDSVFQNQAHMKYFLHKKYTGVNGRMVNTMEEESTKYIPMPIMKDIGETIRVNENVDSQFQMIYIGNVVEFVKQGKGKQITKDFQQEGDQHNDKKHGKSVQIMKDGTRYEGQFVKDKKDGLGEQNWPDGSKYVDLFQDDYLHGQNGLYTWPDGKSYQGEFRYSYWSQGVFWPYGRKYDGEYKNNKKDGYGIFTLPDNRGYKEFWDDGKQHGKGIYITKSGKEKEVRKESQMDQRR